MKKFLLVLVLALQFISIFAQDSSSHPVKWTFSAEKKSATEYILSLKAIIQKDWKLFSTTMKDDEPNSRIQLDSSSAQHASINHVDEKGDLKTKNEALLGNLPIKYFEQSADWQ